MVRSVQTDDAGEEGPGAEGAGGEGRYGGERLGGCGCFGGGGARVDFLGGCEGDVGLDAVEDGDEGDLE